MYITWSQRYTNIIFSVKEEKRTDMLEYLITCNRWKTYIIIMSWSFLKVHFPWSERARTVSNIVFDDSTDVCFLLGILLSFCFDQDFLDDFSEHFLYLRSLAWLVDSMKKRKIYRKVMCRLWLSMFLFQMEDDIHL